MNDTELKEALNAFYEVQEQQPVPDVAPKVMDRTRRRGLWAGRLARAGWVVAAPAAVAAALVIAFTVHAPQSPVVGGPAGGSATPSPSPSPSPSPTAAPTSFNGSTISVSGAVNAAPTLYYINCNVKASTAYANVVVAGNMGATPYYVQIVRQTPPVQPGGQPVIALYQLTGDGQNVVAGWGTYSTAEITYGSDSITVAKSQLAPLPAGIEGGPRGATAPITLEMYLSCGAPPSNPASATSLTLSGAISGPLAVTSVACNGPQADVVTGTVGGVPVTISAVSPQAGATGQLGNPLTITRGQVTYTTTDPANMVFGAATDTFSNVLVPGSSGSAVVVRGVIGCAG